MKKLHLLVIKSYLGPFILTFFIVMFILLMQFIWKYIDDFMGKGLDYWIIAELLFYASANLVSLALPLAVLLSSIMTFGNLAENYELVAMKSSGLSLIRIMLPLIVFILLLSGGAFYFNNVLSPLANLKFKSLLWDVTHTKPSLELKEGIFYNGIDGYSIRVSEKDQNSNRLYDVLIYQHEEKNPGNRRVIRAREGEMSKTPDGRYLKLKLIDGSSYDEMGNENDLSHPHIKSEFEEDDIILDLSGFEMQRTDEDLWKNHMKMMSMEQLKESIDSLQNTRQNRVDNFKRYLRGNVSLTDSTELKRDTVPILTFSELSTIEKRRVINVSINMTRNAKNYMNRTHKEMDNREEYIDKHKIEWHRKLTLSFACVVLFFVGAPLGAIIKKGGLGLPVVFSVIFFLVFHITSISGENMVESNVLSPFTGMWLSSMVLLPIAIFLTYKAAKDAALFDRDTYIRVLNRIRTIFRAKEGDAF
ncbi:MAG: LptF/LptG family permease [Flavobacteriales bacterium]|nr:LptF/LptG family permease [Flavobacteriales bacterium]